MSIAPSVDAPPAPRTPEPGGAEAGGATDGQHGPDDPAAQLLRLLAGELHDGAVQELFSARMDLVELVETDQLPASALPVVERLGQRVDDASRQLRAVLHDMARGQRSTPEAADLVEAIRERVDAFAERHDVTVDLTVSGQGPEPAPACREAMLRVVREGLANVAKHAVASQAVVAIHRGRHWWQVDVDDDGFGDPRAVRISMGRGDDYGLGSLAEHAAAAGGRMWISAAPRLEGIRLSVSVPSTSATAPQTGGRASRARG